jgi:threonine dehydrogenase-like Zn-dependent dehydrogenase
LKAIVYKGPMQLTIEDLRIPVLKPGEAIIRVLAVGICGSELEGYIGHSSVRTPPLVMGHEFCGIIENIAHEVNGLFIGSKVIVNPLISCGLCDRCLNGKPNICRDRQIIGIHRPGAFAEFVAVPIPNIYVVPDEMDVRLASLAEPLAVCIHGVKLGFKSFEDLIIYGAGPIGLLTLQTAMNMGVRRVLVIDRQEDRLEFAKQLGAQTATPDKVHAQFNDLFGSSGVDFIIDCVGAEATRKQAVQLINPGGIITIIGLAQDQTTLPLNHLVRQEITIVGSYTYSQKDFSQAVHLLIHEKISTDSWSTTGFLDEAPAIFQSLVDGSAKFSKYILIPNEGSITK